MPSQVQGYEYDIFISYRHKDNKYDGWVTSFVDHLRSELDATFKEEVSLYFDKNPHDGLHEAHDVDESLEQKIKCLIFIPIISQTYCDPNCFAWQRELLAFRDFAQADAIGPKVKVTNGNVISRILPVCIHELEDEDKRLYETETGGPMRAVDFIFSTAGVNRPLSSSDQASENTHKTFYRDQVNKVAQSIKQLISGIKRNVPVAASQRSTTTEKIQTAHEPRMRSTNWTRILAVGGILSAIAVATYFGFAVFSNANSRPPVKRDKIAVLPFVNLSGNQDNEYFSDGVTEDIITSISKISDLKVISRSSVMRYKNTDKDIVDIGSELGVEMILEGTVRLSGDRARITANLINAVNREQIWADSYDKAIKDLFNLQAEVARDIVMALKANFSELKGRKTPTSNLEAYDLYLRANYQYSKATKEGYRLGTALAKQATVLDSSFALGFALLSEFYSQIVYYQFTDIMSVDLAREQALSTAKRSIELDPHLSEGYGAYGYALRTFQWDWQQSGQQLLKGLSINPDNTSLRRTYALLLAAQCRFEEAMNECDRARELDPLGSIYNSDNARICYYAGKTKEALELTQYAFQIEPGYRPAMGMMATVLERNGLLDSSAVWVSKSATRTGTDYEGLAETFEIGPQPYKAFWKEVMERSLKDIKTRNISSMAMATIFIRNGDNDRALQFLKKGYDAREGSMVYANAEPLFDPIRNDPRFKKIILDMGLKPR
jgi:TolB-like protein